MAESAPMATPISVRAMSRTAACQVTADRIEPTA
jgi:hypothetical protein